jgi:hypothetical protein
LVEHFYQPDTPYKLMEIPQTQHQSQMITIVICKSAAYNAAGFNVAPLE